MSGSIRAKGITKRFGKRTGIVDVTCELPASAEGCIGVLLGPNGAGKSTFLRLVMGLLQADAGELRVLDMDPLRDADRVRRRFGYVPDTPDAPRWMTTNELFGFLAPQYPAWDAACAERLAARFDIPLHTPFRALSRGQGAKAMLVAALAPSPELVLLDEPFSGLDPVARRELLQVFIEELHRLGAAALVATHDLEVAARIADHVLVLDKGRLAAAGPVDMVLGKPDEESARVPARLFDLLKGLTPGREEVAA